MAKQTATEAQNPKIDPKDSSNQIKDPDQWTTGGEPMTGAQASYLKTLSEEAKEPPRSTMTSTRPKRRNGSMRCGIRRVTPESR